MKKPKLAAFTLIELSVSIIIISLILGMAAQGIKIISSSRLNAARSITSRSPVKNISGLVAWYETSSVDSFKTTEASDGKQISTWYDISPNSIPEKKNTLTRAASAAATYATKGIGDIPSVRLTGAETGFILTNFYQGNTSQNTIFLVASPFALSSGNVSMMINNYGGPISSIAFAPNAVEVHLQNNLLFTGSVVVNGKYILASYYNGASSKVFLNNASTALGTADGGTVNILNGLIVGIGSPWPFNGWISEIIIYNRPLQLQERKDVMNYLSKKYGIAVAGL